MTALRSLPIVAALVDDALRVLDCSRRCLALFDVDENAAGAEDRLSRVLSTSTQLGDELALATARLVEPAAAETFEWRRHDRLEVSITADDDDGRTFLVSFDDVTEGRRMEQIQREARSYLEQILADIPLGVAVLDGRLRMTMVNNALLSLLARKPTIS